MNRKRLEPWRPPTNYWGTPAQKQIRDLREDVDGYAIPQYVAIWDELCLAMGGWVQVR